MVTVIKHFGSVIHCVLNRLSQCQVVRNNCAACVQALWLLHEIQCLTDVQTGVFCDHLEFILHSRLRKNG
jgi:hypothetical protein